MGNPVVYFEVLGQGDADEYVGFYSELFGWKPNAWGPAIPYRLVDTRTTAGITGGIGIHPEGRKLVTFYVHTGDLGAMLAKASRMGGKPAERVIEVVEKTLYSTQVASPGGNVVGMISGSWAPERRDEGGRHPVVHFEIGSADPASEQKFWGDLFGWELQVQAEANYALVQPQNGGIGGGIGGSSRGAGYVTFYVQADDPGAVLDKAEELGGKTVAPVMDVPGGPQIAQLADPQGNVIGLVKS